MIEKLTRGAATRRTGADTTVSSGRGARGAGSLLTSPEATFLVTEVTDRRPGPDISQRGRGLSTQSFLTPWVFPSQDQKRYNSSCSLLFLLFWFNPQVGFPMMDPRQFYLQWAAAGNPLAANPYLAGGMRPPGPLPAPYLHSLAQFHNLKALATKTFLEQQNLAKSILQQSQPSHTASGSHCECLRNMNYLPLCAASTTYPLCIMLYRCTFKLLYQKIFK